MGEVVKALGGLTGLIVVVPGLVLFAAVLRLSSAAWYRYRFRRGKPLVLHPVMRSLDLTDGQSGDGGSGGNGGESTTKSAAGRSVDHESRALIGELAGYIGRDPPGPLAPGGLEATGQEATTEAPSPPTTWVTLLSSIAFNRKPGYHVHLTRLDRHGGGEMRVAVAITDEPAGRMVSAETFETKPELMAEAIGAFCVQQVRSQRAVHRRTPRWEQWRSDSGYMDYRRGLDARARGLQLRAREFELKARRRDLKPDQHAEAERYDQRIATAKSKGERQLTAALRYFTRASVADPANLLPRLAEASLLEMTDEIPKALSVYAGCRQLWPENIETAYRLAVHNDRSVGDGSHPPGPRADKAVERLLRRHRIWWRILRASVGTRRNLGERRYWLSWLRPWNSGGGEPVRTKRYEFLAATRIAYLATRLRELTEELCGPLKPDERTKQRQPRQPTESDRALVLELFRAMAKELNDRFKGHPVVRLLHPGEGGQGDKKSPTHNDKWHPQHEPENKYSPFAHFDRRTRHADTHIGRLAHYNAACFFSLALRLPAAARPWNCIDSHWIDDCGSAAVREFVLAVRLPSGHLELSWFRNDDDLAPLASALYDLKKDDNGHPLVVWLRYMPLVPGDGAGS